jgi:TRAP-type mannitol/chloroaromatic compound transport system permease small subunit
MDFSTRIFRSARILHNEAVREEIAFPPMTGSVEKVIDIDGIIFVSLPEMNISVIFVENIFT